MNETEFNALFAAHYVRVLRFVERRVAEQHIAEEIAAETFLLAWSRRDSAEVSLPWLYCTAANKIGDHYKRRKRRATAEGALSRLAEEPPASLAVLDRMALDAALQSLGPRERDVIMLTYWDGLDAADAGEVLGITEQAVWTALTRARQKLRTHLVDPLQTSPGGEHATR